MIKARSSNIKKARLSQGYNQSEVAIGVSINIASYSQIENGKLGLRPKTAKRICQFLNHDFDDLFEIVEKED